MTRITRHRRPSTKRMLTAAAVAAGAAAVVAAAIPAGATDHGGASHGGHGGHGAKKPTVVLVHGAFADSSSFDGVVDRLQKDGYPVVAAANPLRGLQQDAQYLRSVLDSIDGPIVLAGHSYGGMVITEAAAGDRDVKALVYLASFQPAVGESASELAGRFGGGELGPALKEVPVKVPGIGAGTDLYIDQAKFRTVFAADVPANRTRLMAAAQRPITAGALEGKATKAAWRTIPSWALIPRQDKAIPPDSMRWMSRRAGSHITEVNASHAVTVSQPAAGAKIIEQAAQATVR